eukprot:scaffold10647_cov113-Isochrysis_galbana.AAC.10
MASFALVFACSPSLLICSCAPMPPTCTPVSVCPSARRSSSRPPRTVSDCLVAKGCLLWAESGLQQYAIGHRGHTG